jgi:hypothetical protein
MTRPPSRSIEIGEAAFSVTSLMQGCDAVIEEKGTMDVKYGGEKCLRC